MKVNEQTTEILKALPETGMGFQVVRSNQQLYAVFNCIRAIEINSDLLIQQDLEDDLEDDEIKIQNPQLITSSEFSLLGLRGAIDPNYAGGTGTFPLIKKYNLPVATNFYRIIAHGPHDFRYDMKKKELSKGTYLTTELDKVYANTGFAVVGRYALPVPLPANYCIQYELPKGTQLKAGTVAPNFGQAGGGVEVLLNDDTVNVKLIGLHVLPDF